MWFLSSISKNTNTDVDNLDIYNFGFQEYSHRYIHKVRRAVMAFLEEPHAQYSKQNMLQEQGFTHTPQNKNKSLIF